MLNLKWLQIIKAGTGIIAACQSGNRDAEVFSDPDTFNINRTFKPADSLGFGYGAHRCIAEWLAKAELELVFCKLTRGFAFSLSLFPFLLN